MRAKEFVSKLVVSRRPYSNYLNNGLNEAKGGPALTRAEEIERQLKRAVKDSRFKALVREGDLARDSQNWAAAEHSYMRGLALYPFHPGYRAQYAHMLKEQGKFAAAEAHYRSAFATGCPIEDVKPHLAFATAQNGGRLEALDTPNFAVTALKAPPTMFDIEALALVFFHDSGAISLNEAALLMRRHRTNEQVALALLLEDRFLRLNLPFLHLLQEQ